MAIIRTGFASGDGMLSIDPTSKAARLGLFNSKGEYAQFNSKKSFSFTSTNSSSPLIYMLAGSDLGLVRVTSFTIGVQATAAASQTIELQKTFRVFSHSFTQLVPIPSDTNSGMMEGHFLSVTGTSDSPPTGIRMAVFSVAITAVVPNSFGAQPKDNPINVVDIVKEMGIPLQCGIPLRSAQEGLLLVQTSAPQTGQVYTITAAGTVEPYDPAIAPNTQPSTYNY